MALVVGRLRSDPVVMFGNLPRRGGERLRWPLPCGWGYCLVHRGAVAAPGTGDGVVGRGHSSLVVCSGCVKSPPFGLLSTSLRLCAGAAVVRPLVLFR